MKPRRARAFAAVVSLTLVATAAAQDSATAAFDRNVRAYVELRDRAVRHTAPLDVSTDPQEIERTSDALAARIRAARPSARRGEIFDSTIADALRHQIDATLRRQHYTAADLLREIRSGAPTESARLAVNARFDWAYGAQMPGSVIAALPPLPDDLQYRFVGADLVLIDVPACLIVDILPDALVVD
jgi:hypothetical protein